jgi:hypothetical protein
MIKTVKLLMVVARLCTINTDTPFGTVECETNTGKVAAISSSAFNYTKAVCSINGKNVVTCKNVSVVDSDIIVTVVIDLDKQIAHVK